MLVTIDIDNKKDVERLMELLGKNEAEPKPAKQSKAKSAVKSNLKGVEATKAPKEVSEPTPEPENTSTSLDELQELAREKARAAGRDAVKKLIAIFAPKLTEVKPDDYNDLKMRLEGLKG